jgi:acyl carrier protein
MSDISSRVKAIIVDTVELIMEFEKEFDIQIPDDQAENIATVGQAIQFIEQAD